MCRLFWDDTITGASGGDDVSSELATAGVLKRSADVWVTNLTIAWALGEGAKEETVAKFEDQLLEVAAELAGPDPSPSERMLAETAALNWFTLRRHEAYLAALSTGKTPLKMGQSEFHQRRIDRVHKRLMSTLRTLAAVRKLAQPAVQINLARQQVNVAGAAGSPYLFGRGAGEETP
jgi:hypothetical protein